jgi:hypothetical protein
MYGLEKVASSGPQEGRIQLGISCFFDSFLVGNGNVCDEGFLWSLIYE